MATRPSTPIAALAVFREAARAESFRAAAQVLSVTPGAVSRRIRQLETRLGTTLFERRPQGVRLNQHGAALLAAIAPGIAAIDSAWAEAAARARGHQTLSISAPPSFADHWLSARIKAFEDTVSPVEIEASQAFIAPSWQGDRIDLAVRYGVGPWPGVAHYRLMADRLLPVVTPGHPLAGLGAVASAIDWAAYPLYEVRWPARQPAITRADLPGWADWLAAYACRADNTRITSHHSRYDDALAAAVDTGAIVLASRVIVADRLASGALVAPFGVEASIATPFEFALVVPEHGGAPPLALAFIDWLQAQAHADTACQ